MTPSLTPLGIRGKRKPSSKRTTPIPSALTTESNSNNNNNKRLKSLKSVIAQRSSHPTTPTLQSLPAEVLEKILLYSQNLALPHASPVIGLRLSETATLIRLVQWAFHDTWERWFGDDDDEARGGGQGNAESDGDAILQSAIFKQPWANADLFLTAQQTWVDKFAPDRIFTHKPPWEQSPSTLSHPRTHPSSSSSSFSILNCFQTDYSQALLWPPFRPLPPSSWSYHHAHPKALIPLPLITGPWSLSQTKLLFWLTRAGLKPQGQGQQQQQQQDESLAPWEDKILLLKNVALDVEKPNVLAMNCLLGPWVFEGLPEDVTRREIRRIDDRLKWGDDTEETRVILRNIRDGLR